MTAQKLPQSDVNHILMHLCVDANDTVALSEEAEFTLKVSRGKQTKDTFSIRVIRCATAFSRHS